MGLEIVSLVLWAVVSGVILVTGAIACVTLRMCKERYRERTVSKAHKEEESRLYMRNRLGWTGYIGVSSTSDIALEDTSTGDDDGWGVACRASEDYHTSDVESVIMYGAKSQTHEMHNPPSPRESVSDTQVGGGKRVRWESDVSSESMLSDSSSLSMSSISASSTLSESSFFSD